jgi:integrase
MAHARLPRRDYVLMLLYADTGVRPGEAPPLRWPDFDPAARTLTVERAVSDGVVGATKTDERRVIDLTPRLVDALNTLQAQRESEAILAGDDPSPLIFPSSANTPLDPSAIAKIFRSVLRGAGVPRHRLYDLRHTFASQLLAENAPPLYVAAQMGDRIETVFRHYAAWVPRGDSQWAVRLAASREAAEKPSARLVAIW